MWSCSGGSSVFLLPPGILVDQASRTKEKGSNVLKITSENALNQSKTFPSVQRSLSHCGDPKKTVQCTVYDIPSRGIHQKSPACRENV